MQVGQNPDVFVDDQQQFLDAEQSHKRLAVGEVGQPAPCLIHQSIHLPRREAEVVLEHTICGPAPSTRRTHQTSIHEQRSTTDTPTGHTT